MSAASTAFDITFDQPVDPSRGRGDLRRARHGWSHGRDRASRAPSPRPTHAVGRDALSSSRRPTGSRPTRDTASGHPGLHRHGGRAAIAGRVPARPNDGGAAVVRFRPRDGTIDVARDAASRSVSPTAMDRASTARRSRSLPVRRPSRARSAGPRATPSLSSSRRPCCRTSPRSSITVGATAEAADGDADRRRRARPVPDRRRSRSSRPRPRPRPSPGGGARSGGGSARRRPAARSGAAAGAPSRPTTWA